MKVLDFWVDGQGRDWWLNSWGSRHANNGVGYAPKADKLKVMRHPMFRAYGVRQLGPGR